MITVETAIAAGVPGCTLPEATHPITVPIMPERSARIKLPVTPARWTIMFMILGLLNLFSLFGLYMTGLPHPNPAMRSRIVPTGSRCAIGLKVSLPILRGVGSPSQSATNACMNSWIENDSISANSITRP